VIALMQALNRETGQTFVVVTHDPLVAAQTARTVVLSDGRVQDEQVHALSGRSVPEAIALMQELNRESGQTSGIATHDPAVAA
jgi:ABC-type lipoprotein export system ATPase subunit